MWSGNAPGWPAVLRDGDVTVRPLRMRDAGAWVESRRRNAKWLEPWEATPPAGAAVFGASTAVFSAMTRRLRADARQGRALPFVIVLGKQFAGQINVAGVVRGSMDGAHIGYWIDERFAGRGVMPTAVALVVDHCFRVVGLHRIEVNIRPENHASRRVVEKLGFRDEGIRKSFLHIDGDWRDHRTYALVQDEVPGGLLRRWHQSQRRAETVQREHRDTPA
ncbi:MAG TPA: GNAT family protein [Mycobacteriales bacterium]|nr:GNAT family protein [Mycobacteriales bacterium]